MAQTARSPALSFRLGLPPLLDHRLAHVRSLLHVKRQCLIFIFRELFAAGAHVSFV